MEFHKIGTSGKGSWERGSNGPPGIGSNADGLGAKLVGRLGDGTVAGTDSSSITMSLGENSEARTRVAGWFIFKPKHPNLGQFWRPLDWKKVDLFYGHLEYFTFTWDI
jgi:hypothetical protein